LFGQQELARACASVFTVQNSTPCIFPVLAELMVERIMRAVLPGTLTMSRDPTTPPGTNVNLSPQASVFGCDAVPIGHGI
jgi:hypothetical protein